MVMIVDRARQLLPQAALLSAGALSALGFAPLNLWPLTILGLAFLLERGFAATRARQAFELGWCFALGHFLVGLNWIAEAFTHQDSMPAWLGWVGVMLISAYLALYTGLACALAWRLSARSATGWVLLLAAGWMLGEWARAGVFGGFAWNPLAVIWLGVPLLAQGAKWVGSYGMSGLVVLAAGALWLGLRVQWRLTAGVAAGLMLLASLILSEAAAPVAPTTGGIPVHIVQPNISEDEKHDPDEAETNLRRYLALSVDPHASPRLMLWPEGALLQFLELDSERPLRQMLAGLLGPGDILLTGGPSVILGRTDTDYVFHNSVFALSGSGQVLWRYDKAHLVPFGEFLPARPLLSRLGLSRLVQSDGDFTPGPGPRTFALPGFAVDGRPLTVAVQICYEIIFSGSVVDEAHRPSFVFNPSNDAWFGAWGPPQHLAQAQLRAIEEGLPIIRATPNGISAVISPEGRVLARIPHQTQGVIDSRVPAALPPTLFSQLGLWASLLFGLAVGGTGLALSRGWVRMPRPHTPVLEQPPPA
jgi:apolipoprotein N-acyltransferase